MDKCFHFHSTQGVGHSQFQSISLQRGWKSNTFSVLLREASFLILSMSSPAARQPAASAGPGECSLQGASGFELPLSEIPTEAKAPKVTTFQFMICWFMTCQFVTHLSTYTAHGGEGPTHTAKGQDPSLRQEVHHDSGVSFLCLSASSE